MSQQSDDDSSLECDRRLLIEMGAFLENKAQSQAMESAIERFIPVNMTQQEEGTEHVASACAGSHSRSDKDIDPPAEAVGRQNTSSSRMRTRPASDS